MSIFQAAFWSGLFKSAAPVVLAAATTCAPPAAPPTISFAFQPEQPQVTNNLDHQALGKFTVATQFSHGRNETFLTGGITESNISTQYNLTFRQMVDRSAGTACLTVSHIDMVLKYAPVVHIASNYAPNSCRFRTTWEHELRHVNTDMLTLQERQGDIYQAAVAGAAQLGAVGPVAISAVPDTQQAIIAKLSQSVDPAFKGVDNLRMQRQQLIDTRQEYLRLSALCPGEGI